MNSMSYDDTIFVFVLFVVSFFVFLKLIGFIAYHNSWFDKKLSKAFNYLMKVRQSTKFMFGLSIVVCLLGILMCLGQALNI